MATLNTGSAFVDGQLITAAAVNSKFSTIETFVNPTGTKLDTENLNQPYALFPHTITLSDATGSKTQDFSIQTPAGYTLIPKAVSMHVAAITGGGNKELKMSVQDDGAEVINGTFLARTTVGITTGETFSINSIAGGSVITVKITSVDLTGTDGSSLVTCHILFKCLLKE